MEGTIWWVYLSPVKSSCIKRLHVEKVLSVPFLETDFARHRSGMAEWDSEASTTEHKGVTCSLVVAQYCYDLVVACFLFAPGILSWYVAKVWSSSSVGSEKDSLFSSSTLETKFLLNCVCWLLRPNVVWRNIGYWHLWWSGAVLLSCYNINVGISVGWYCLFSWFFVVWVPVTGKYRASCDG